MRKAPQPVPLNLIKPAPPPAPPPKRYYNLLTLGIPLDNKHPLSFYFLRGSRCPS